MILVDVRDDVIWLKHIHGDDDFKGRLQSMKAGQLIRLRVDGVEGYWKKMADGKDGRPTQGLRPLPGDAHDQWRMLQARRGEHVPLEEV